MNTTLDNVIVWEDEEVEEIVDRFRLTDAAGEVLMITKADKRLSERYGEYVVLESEHTTEYYSFSKLLMGQYEKLQGMLSKGYIVKARVKINRNRQVYLGVA